jgi:hypothetical protein
MYIRWQTYHSRARNPELRARNAKQARLKAVLVESVRIDGKPRQKHIAVLGSLPLDAIADKGSPGSWRDHAMTTQRHRFWRIATARLDPFGPETRARILASIAEKVAPMADAHPPATEPPEGEPPGGALS